MSATDPLLYRTTFVLDFTEVTGPAFHPTYARVDMLSRDAEVTVRIRDGEAHAARVQVFGSRAKKDGTASVLPAEAGYTFASYSNDEPPEHVMAAVREAVRLVNGMLSGTNEVSV